MCVCLCGNQHTILYTTECTVRVFCLPIICTSTERRRERSQGREGIMHTAGTIYLGQETKCLIGLHILPGQALLIKRQNHWWALYPRSVDGRIYTASQGDCREEILLEYRDLRPICETFSADCQFSISTKYITYIGNKNRLNCN